MKTSTLIVSQFLVIIVYVRQGSCGLPNRKDTTNMFELSFNDLLLSDEIDSSQLDVQNSMDILETNKPLRSKERKERQDTESGSCSKEYAKLKDKIIIDKDAEIKNLEGILNLCKEKLNENNIFFEYHK